MTQARTTDPLEGTILVQEPVPALLFRALPSPAPPPYRMLSWFMRVVVVLFLLMLSGPLTTPWSPYWPFGSPSSLIPPYVVERPRCRFPLQVARLASCRSLELRFHDQTAATADVNANERLLDRMTVMR